MSDRTNPKKITAESVRAKILQICEDKEIAPTKSLLNQFDRFYKSSILKHDHLDESVISLYIHSFIFLFMKLTVEKRLFFPKMKMTVIEKCLKEVKKFLEQREEVETETRDVCNLYSIHGYHLLH